jgi:hypothetical protein
MPRLSPLALFLPLALLADAPGGGEWKLDVIHRKDAEPLRGLIVEDARDHVTIRCVSRKPGRPTMTFTVKVPRGDISRIDELSKEDRDKLQARLAALKREFDSLTQRLRALDPGAKPSPFADHLDLQQAAWPGDGKAKVLRYKSAYFELVANTRPELARLAAIHLEEVYAAYARSLPPRDPKAAPTTILLTRSLAEYRRMALDRGLKLVNPAFYDPEKNQVVCGSDLEKMCDDLEAVRDHHVKLKATIKERRAELARVYKNKVPAELLAPMADAEKRVEGVERRNDAVFAEARRRMFQRLYHEAFHGYLNTFVYPRKDGELPLWFNEGLAQIFETAIVEAGELRVRHADEPRLVGVRRAIKDKRLMPLADLLRSEARDFQMAHVGEKQESDRHYLAAWALAFHLTFEQGVLGTRALDDYVAALKRGTDPLLAFRDLVGKPLPEFEKEFQAYLGRLRPDGTAPK